MKLNKKFITGIIAAITSIGILISSGIVDDNELINKEKIDNNQVIQSTINHHKQSPYLEILLKIIGIPIWAIVSLLIKLLNKSIKMFNSLLLMFLLKFIIFFIFLLLIIIICIKLIFPNLKIKNIINKRLIISTLIGTICYIFVDYFIKDNEFEYLIIFFVGLIVLIINLIPFIKIKNNEKQLLNSVNDQ